MLSVKVLTTILLGVASAAAMPAEGANLESRNAGLQKSITLCDRKFLETGDTGCATYQLSTGQCRDLDQERINNLASSVSIPAGIACRFFDNLNCTNTNGTTAALVQAPGLSDFDTIGLNDEISSFLCVISPSAST